MGAGDEIRGEMDEVTAEEVADDKIDGGGGWGGGLIYRLGREGSSGRLPAA